MKNIALAIFTLIFSCFTKGYSQCNQIETVTICDMTTIDNDADGMPDGIINLYEQFNAITGSTFSTSTGLWADPNFNFALDEATGDLYLWDLDNASEDIMDYQFQLIDPTSSCPGGLIATVNLILGPFEGSPLPPQGANDANITICETVLSAFDLSQVFESQPSPHKNGVWAFVDNLGDPSNFLGLTPEGMFSAKIPYVPFGDLIEFDVFEFTYTVPGIAPCSASTVSTFKVEVIRDVQSGSPTDYSICEDDILAGLWDADINLRDDAYLTDEDFEGLWSSVTDDPTGQISNPLDSEINIREIYDFLKATNPRFSCETYTFEYNVEARTTLSACPDRLSTISFTFYEPIKPFQQNNPPIEICADGSQPDTIDLYNTLVFTTENGVLYDYPNNACTNWELVSGPSNLGLANNTGSLCDINLPDDEFYTSKGTINVKDITNADAGTYVFRFTVSPDYVCVGNTCSGMSADVTLVIHPKNYAGEDTIGLEFCEIDPLIAAPLDLFSLLTTNMIDDPIYQGPLGTWLDGITGDPIANIFTIPEIDGKQIFDFVYSTRTENGCLDRASLSFTVFEAYDSGISNAIDVCSSDTAFNLFDSLMGDPSSTGTWSGPEGFITTDENATFDPETSEAGVYTYTVPDNVNDLGDILCSGKQSTVTVTLHQSPNAGASGLFSACQSDGDINLLDYLASDADSGGSFRDLDATNELTGTILDVSTLSSGRYNFQYEIQGHASCALATSIITISVTEVEAPLASNQTFCAIDGATIDDLEANRGLTFNWYDTAIDTTPLPMGTVLIDGEDYFVSALDADSCESSRVSITVTILPVGNLDCDDCIKDGISVNDDGINDEFDLCNLPIVYPNFEIKIFNRYGTIVYNGNQNTPLFKGISNVALTIGEELPTGVYFYVFDPKDETAKPFQGNFYLSR